MAALKFKRGHHPKNARRRRKATRRTSKRRHRQAEKADGSVDRKTERKAESGTAQTVAVIFEKRGDCGQVAEKKQLTIGDSSVDVTQIEVTKRGREDFVEYELEDGAVVRVVNPVVLAYRLDHLRDPEGNPTYIVKLGTSVTVIRGPRK